MQPWITLHLLVPFFYCLFSHIVFPLSVFATMVGNKYYTSAEGKYSSIISKKDYLMIELERMSFRKQQDCCLDAGRTGRWPGFAAGYAAHRNAGSFQSGKNSRPVGTRSVLFRTCTNSSSSVVHAKAVGYVSENLLQGIKLIICDI